MTNEATKPTTRRQAETHPEQATLTPSPNPVKKREPVKNKEEYGRHSVLRFDILPRKWQDDSITMDEGEFKALLKKKLRIIHTQCIGYKVSEGDETFETKYDPINVIIYGSDGYRINEPEQEVVYSFYVRYKRYLWSAFDIMRAIKIVESIRQGEILCQKKNNEVINKRRAKKTRKAK